MIYADNAATTKLSERAKNAMDEVLRNGWGNPSALYSEGRKAREKLEQARADIAAIIGAEPEEIYFTSGGTEADNQVIQTGWRRREKFQRADAFYVSSIEHHAVLNPVKKYSGSEFLEGSVWKMGVGENGIIKVSKFENTILKFDFQVALVSVMYANNEIGTIQPIRKIGEICRRSGVPFHTDAVQAVGHIPINVKDDNIDFLSASAHKFHGPKGAGFLFADRRNELYSFIRGGGQERGKRAGTENVAGAVGMAEALKESVENMEQNTRHLLAMRKILTDGLREIPHAALNGDEENRLPGNVNFCFEGVPGEALVLMLDRAGICASSGSACTTGTLEPSHVLKAIGRDDDTANSALRLTIGEDITKDEAETIVKEVKKAVSTLRETSPEWHYMETGRKPHKI